MNEKEDETLTTQVESSLLEKKLTQLVTEYIDCQQKQVGLHVVHLLSKSRQASLQAMFDKLDQIHRMTKSLHP